MSYTVADRRPRHWIHTGGPFGVDKGATFASASNTYEEAERDAAIWQHLISREIRLILHHRHQTVKDVLAVPGSLSEAQWGRILRGDTEMTLRHLCLAERLLHRRLVSVTLPNQRDAI